MTIHVEPENEGKRMGIVIPQGGLPPGHQSRPRKVRFDELMTGGALVVRRSVRGDGLGLPLPPPRPNGEIAICFGGWHSRQAKPAEKPVGRLAGRHNGSGLLSCCEIRKSVNVQNSHTAIAPGYHA